MFSILSTVGPEIPFTLALLALLGLRARVVPRVSLWLSAPAEKVFQLIDLYDGKLENWGRSKVLTEAADASGTVFRKRYRTTMMSGIERETSALFRIEQRQPPAMIEVKREGLEGKPLDNELLAQAFRVTPENGGCRLSIEYTWGPRALLAQLTARADLWGGIYRLKGLAETGKPDEKPYQLISAGVALLTGLLSLACFAIIMGWLAAALLVFALFYHELGHLVAYRLMGQPWGRMIFLPFLGAIAMPRLPFESQGQVIFAALMGPGFSTVLAAICVLPGWLGVPWHPLVSVLGLITAGVNIFNLLPVEPLDGGIALRSVLARWLGSYARLGLMAVGALIAAIGLLLSQILLVIFGGIAILANLKKRDIDAGLAPLTNLQVAITVAGYVTMVSAYITLLRYFFALISPAPN